MAQEKKKLEEKAPIDKFRPTERQRYVEASGKILVIHFEKIFGRPKQTPEYLKKLSEMDEFYITKGVCSRIVDFIAKYINYFMVKYDPENELAFAYLHLKAIIERNMVEKEISVPILDANGEPMMEEMLDDMGFPLINNVTGKVILRPLTKREVRRVPEINTIEDLVVLKKYIYENMFTPSICEKIRRLVDDNYIEDIESDNSKYRKSEKTYLENLEFNNHHMIIMNRISFGMKLIAPVLYHAFSHRNIKYSKPAMIACDFYEPLFKLFQDDVDMFNKLYVYTRTNISIKHKYNTVIFSQREVFGQDVKTVVDDFLKDKIINDIIVKFEFSGSVLKLIRTVINFQFKCLTQVRYSKDIVDISNDRDEEGLSGIDKMEMHRPKIDEGQIIYSDFNIEYSFNKIMDKYGDLVTDDEIRYYQKRVRPNDTVMQFVRYYWYPYFNQSTDLENLGDKYWPLMIIMKKRMIADANRDPKSGEVYPDLFLPYVISGNLEGSFKQKAIRKEKELKEVRSSYVYIETMKKYRSINEYDEHYFDNLLSKMAYSRFTYVCYEDPKWNGEPIEVPVKNIFADILSILNDH